MGNFTMKSILFALATASVAWVVKSAPSSIKNNAFEVNEVINNVDSVQILPISKRSIRDKQEYFAVHSKTGHGGINKKAKQISNAAKRRKERAERRKIGAHKSEYGRSDEGNVVRSVKGPGKKTKKGGKRSGGKKNGGKRKK